MDNNALSDEGRALAETFGSMLVALLNELMVQGTIQPTTALPIFRGAISRLEWAGNTGVDADKRQAIIAAMQKVAGI